MPSPDQALLQYANEIAEHLGRQKASLDKELSELKRQILTKQTQSDLAGSAVKRLLDFRPSFGRNLRCPNCWVTNGVHSTLRTASGGTNREDFFACDTCGREFSVEF